MLNREFAEDSIKHTPKRGVPGIGGNCRMVADTSAPGTRPERSCGESADAGLAQFARVGIPEDQGLGPRRQARKNRLEHRKQDGLQAGPVARRDPRDKVNRFRRRIQASVAIRRFCELPIAADSHSPFRESYASQGVRTGSLLRLLPIGGGMRVNAVSPPVFIEFQSTVLRRNVSLVSDGRHQALSDPCRPCCYKRTSPGSSGAQREVWVGPGQLN